MQSHQYSGHIGSDSESHNTSEGTWVNFPLAIGKDKEDKTIWIKCSRFYKDGRGADVAKYLTKGRPISITSNLVYPTSYVNNQNETVLNLVCQFDKVELL